MTSRAAGSNGGMLGNEGVGPEAFAASFSIGNLLLVVFGQDFIGSGLSKTGRPLKLIRPNAEFGRFLLPLWPSQEPVVVWRPRLRLSEDEAGAMFERFVSSMAVAPRPDWFTHRASPPSAQLRPASDQ